MPTYSYYCQDGHETTWFGRFAVKPEHLDCGACGEKAFLGVAKLEPEVAQQNEEWRERLDNYAGLSLHDFKCEDCKKITEEMIDHGEGENPSNGITCECGSHAVWLPSSRIDRFSERFPYYDNGLGMVLHSKQQRLDECKKRGLTPVDGDWDVDKYTSKQDAEEDRLTAEYEEYCDRLDNDPAFRDYRKASDQGRI